MEEAPTHLHVSNGDGIPANAGLEHTLRRRRSAASAALLSRPSTLTLGELTPSFETCVLIYLSSNSIGTTTNDAQPRLVYALFEPSFLVDGTSQSVRKLDRTSWEHLRSHVEDLRIVALSSRGGDGMIQPNTPMTSAAPALRKPDCVFDLSVPTDNPSQRTISQIYLQPESYASVPARSKDEVLQIEIHAPTEAGRNAEERWCCLPAQVRAILQDAEQLMKQVPTPLTPQSATLSMAKGSTDGSKEAGFAATRDQILRLIRGPVADS